MNTGRVLNETWIEEGPDVRIKESISNGDHVYYAYLSDILQAALNMDTPVKSKHNCDPIRSESYSIP